MSSPATEHTPAAELFGTERQAYQAEPGGLDRICVGKRGGGKQSQGRRVMEDHGGNGEKTAQDFTNNCATGNRGDANPNCPVRPQLEASFRRNIGHQHIMQPTSINVVATDEI